MNKLFAFLIISFTISLSSSAETPIIDSLKYKILSAQTEGDNNISSLEQIVEQYIPVDLDLSLIHI